MTEQDIIDLMISGSTHYMEYCRNSRRLDLRGQTHYVSFIEKNPDGYKLGDDDVFVLTISGYDRDNSLMDFSGHDEKPYIYVQEQVIEYAIDDVADALIEDKDKIAINVKNMPDNQLLSQYCNMPNAPVVVVSDLLFLIQRVILFYKSMKEDKSQLFLPSVGSRVKNIMPLPKMSSEQIEAMNKAFVEPLLYVWGAPGTGKTLHVLVPCVINYMLKGEKVLVVTPTNSTADNVAKAIIDKIKSLENYPVFKELNPLAVRRVGSGVGKEFRKNYSRNCETASDRIRTSILSLENKINDLNDKNKKLNAEIRAEERRRPLWFAWFRQSECRSIDNDVKVLNGKIETNNREIERLQKRVGQLKQKIREMPETNNVDAMVVVGTADHSVANMKYYTSNIAHIFIDEVASLPLPKGMVLLATNKPITMFGDHKQLPPIDNINKDKITPDTKDMGIWRLSMLYMADIFNSWNNVDDVITDSMEDVIPAFRNIQTVTLSKTYRYDRKLTDILRRYVYKTRLDSANENSTQCRFRLIDNRNNTGKKRVNTAEIDAICDIIRNCNVKGSIGIISAYKNQAAELESAIKKLKHDKKIAIISTIHRAQGREYDTVILSVSDTTNNAYFTDTQKPIGQLCMNVAVSRAKQTLIIVCDSSWQAAKQQMISEIIAISTPI